jgi:8-oxo-dGTP pyrophosphatase MutT (NUDIX family)
MDNVFRSDPPPQQIPQPARFEPARTPLPWQSIDAAGRAGITMASVASGLARRSQTGDLPNDVLSAASLSPAELTAELDLGLAAVLVVLFEEAGEVRVVLTRRALSLRRHAGEVSFPGGRLELTETARQAALREAREEIDLDPASVTTLGWLHPLATYGGDSRVLPIVGSVAQRPTLTANPDEVARVFDVRLSELLVDGVCRQERWWVPSANEADSSHLVTFFELPGDIVWGATARLLLELLSLVLDVAWSEPTGGH